jgi:hypothetical protein
VPAKTKAITAAMKKKIVKAARALGIAAPDISDGGGKTYEAWVLLELAARVTPAVTVSAQDHQGSPTTAFRVRGGPGFIPPLTAAPGQPCHFLLEGSRRRAELHSSLRHRAASGDTHELDVSAIDLQHAWQIRHAGGGPVDGSPFGHGTILGLELKEYDKASSLPKVYPRALLGVALDLEPYGHVVIERRGHARAFPVSGADFWLLTTTTLGTSRGLLDHHDINWRANVEPGPGEDQLQDVADCLKARLQ